MDEISENIIEYLSKDLVTIIKAGDNHPEGVSLSKGEVNLGELYRLRDIQVVCLEESEGSVKVRMTDEGLPFYRMLKRDQEANWDRYQRLCDMMKKHMEGREKDV